MFLCTYIVLKASFCVTFIVIFATRASIVCIDSGTCDTIRVSLALAIWFFDILINRYTPSFDVIIRPAPEGAGWTTPEQTGQYSHYNMKLDIF